MTLSPDLLWYYETFVIDPERGYAVMNIAGADTKYNRKKTPLTVDLVASAFNGATRRLQIAGRWYTFPLSFAAVPEHREGWVNRISIDVDTGGAEALRRLLVIAQVYGLWGFAQLSESTDHKGGHGHFPIQPVPGHLAAQVARQLMAAAAVEGEAYPRPAGSETPDLRLPLMMHLRAPSGPRRFPLLLLTGELIDATNPLHALADLRAAWQVNSLEAVTTALDSLPQITLAQPVKTHKSKVNPRTSELPIKWFNQNYDLLDVLSDAGAKGRGAVLQCPFHDDKNPSLAVFAHDDGHLVCRCFSQNSNCPASADNAPYWDAFNVFCWLHKLTFAEGVKKLVDDHALGQRRTLKIEPATPVAQQNDDTGTQVPADSYSLEDHQAMIALKRGELAEAIAGAVAGRARTIRATMGLGKTHYTARYAIEQHEAGKVVAIVSPTHDMALEWQKEHIPDALIWRSRLDICTCHDTAYLRKLAELGYALPKCSGGCPYIDQHAQRQGRIVIFQHNHLALEGGKLLLGSDLVIIDESPLGALIEEHTASLDDLTALGNRLTQPGRDDPAVPLLRALWRVGKAHGRQSQSLYGQALRDALVADLGTADLADVLASARQSPAAIHNPQQPPGHIEPTKQFLAGLLDALDHDMARPEGNSLLAWARIGDGVWGWCWHERHTMLSKLYGRTDAPAVLVLDGSANAAVCEQLYAPWPVDMVVIDAPLSPAVRVIQCPSTVSTRKLVQDPDLLERTARAVAAVCDGLDVTIDAGISYMAVKDVLQQHLGGEWLHYGGQRGKNDFAGVRALAIIASPTMPPDTIYRKCMALWSDDSKPIYAAWERKGVGEWRAIDDRLDAVANLHGPEELRQAAFRCRPLTASEPTTLLIFSPWQLADLGLQPTQRITQLPHGNSTEAQAAYERYQERRRVELEQLASEAYQERDVAAPVQIAPVEHGTQVPAISTGLKERPIAPKGNPLTSIGHRFTDPWEGIEERARQWALQQRQAA